MQANSASTIYIYITSDQSDNYFHGNTPSSFRIKLPRRLFLAHDSSVWYVALLDISFPNLKEGYKPTYITIHSNICQTSIVNGSQAAVLQRVYKGQLSEGMHVTFDSPRYIPVSVDSADTIEIYLTDYTGTTPSFQEGQSSCTLHITKFE